MNTKYRNSKFGASFSVAILALLCSCALVYLLSGCEKSSRKNPSLTRQIQLLEEQNSQLTRQLNKSTAESEQLKKQLQVLAGIPDKLKLENIYDLQSVKIGRYTNLYDKDKDGKKETLIVYIQPMDVDGDIIKAAGEVDVQLWDLNTEPNKALLGQWHVKPDELKKLWFATLLAINYRLTFDVADIIRDPKEPLTVKVTFTDHLTGKVFKEQKEIKPQAD